MNDYSNDTKEAEYRKLDDGLGGTYERIAYGATIERLADEFRARRVLELNATFIAGVPGFNSAMLAQDGYEVTITVHSRDYEDTVSAWQLANLYDRVTIIEWNDDFATPFKDEQFDLVWNHLAFEHYEDPVPLVEEMRRIADELVINFTLSPYNLGFMLHWLVHKMKRKRWDHGYIKNCLISTMKQTHIQTGLIPIEWGGCDGPPWLDTVDAQAGGSMRYVGNIIGERKWVWCAINPEARDHWLVKRLWKMEYLMPNWFKVLTAHHLYVASKKMRNNESR